jgi:hypothetical protein
VGSASQLSSPLYQLGLDDSNYVVNAHLPADISPKYDIGEPELVPICSNSATLAYSPFDPVKGTGNYSLSHFLAVHFLYHTKSFNNIFTST